MREIGGLFWVGFLFGCWKWALLFGLQVSFSVSFEYLWSFCVLLGVGLCVLLAFDGFDLVGEPESCRMLDSLCGLCQ